ncbi:glycerophosphodiesterase, putative [Phytophthora infestans T30-4]|uniref:Glycerophosphodiesterase, putative n=1 Tax=Phytophthora infestans (strain T30-4) TaxID=403677 RepID=D0NLI1_PHYIT|nr:glycerophosphodiesterase, putative [Phytophthora infestans T30-4]EEY60528.1 glycerophosphodiesterase, putative [Phytophthora infestans T30-4]|eukprot:XP_002899901.1 glycerophosphodiesterase, putative [Phytophthora infestans T30-4]
MISPEAEVEFAVRLIGDAREHMVCLLGSAAEIGAWVAEKAVPMELVERQDNESKWRATIEFSPATNTLEYKYVVKDERTRELVSWEGLPGNRTLTIAPGTNVALGASSSQSSTYTTPRVPTPGPRDAKLGNNGNTNGFEEWRCCRTNKESNPWWEVDLGQEYAISSIHLWNAMTYHEQARRPEGRPPLTSKASTSSPEPPLWVFISKEQLGCENASYNEAQDKATADSSSVRAIQVPSLYDSRVRSLNFAVNASSLSGAPAFSSVKGRYVRLQCAGALCALQFAELEVFTQDAAVPVVNSKETQQTSTLCHTQDDGFFGVAKALDSDMRDFDSTTPAIQWLSGEQKHSRVAIEMRHEKQKKGTNEAKLQDGNSQVKEMQPVSTWEPLPVESKSAALLDKESTEMNQLLETHQQLAGADISAYLNNATSSTAAPSNLSWVLRLAFAQSLEASNVEILGNAIATRKYKNASIRDDYIRSRRKAASLRKDRKLHYTDDTHAQVFRVKIPVATVDGSGNYTDGLSHRWTFDVYDCQKDAKSGAFARNELLGSAYLLPSQIGKQGEADLAVPILSSNKGIVGQLSLSCLALTPFVHPKNNIANVWRSYWRERPPLTIGHRGMGRSYYQVEGHRLALTRENTLASLIMAGRSGAEFVEFDVQLTKDRVPVIYHDFMVNVGLEDKSAESHGTRHEKYEIGIHDMTFRQLTQSYTTPVPHEGTKTQLLQNRVKKHWARLQGDKQVPSPRRGRLASDDNTNEEHHLVDFFPRLEDLLKHVPAEVGLNIEVKFPDDFFRPGMRSLSCFAINAYVDRLLQCVFDFAGSRRIFFSCFDPNVCIVLRAKQAKYPVLFLTYGSMAPHAFDARMTLQFATNFAKMEKLQGIVSNSNSFLETPELASLVKRYLGTVLITWGDQNTKHEMVQLQKRHAIDGVISDNVIDLINQDKRLLAQTKGDILERP